MSDTTIDVPGLGPTKSVYVYTAGAATLGIITYAWWSRRNQAPATDPTAILSDPALSQDSGGTTTPGITTTVSTETPDPGSLPPTTNTEWAQRATDILVNTLGYDAQTVAQAIGDYLARQGLTGNQANMIRVAWGQLGRPPVGDFPITTVSDSTPPPPAATPPPPYTGVPAPAPAPAKNVYPDKFGTVLAGWHVDQWILDMRAQGRVPPTWGWTELALHNPSIATNVVWHTNSALNTFKKTATYTLY